MASDERIDTLSRVQRAPRMMYSPIRSMWVRLLLTFGKALSLKAPGLHVLVELFRTKQETAWSTENIMLSTRVASRFAVQGSIQLCQPSICVCLWSPTTYCAT